jgi:2-dehydro-3-deoxyphosphogluconate aldolase/(4S)-4-hydroxy-2-oxoglutarate aldolase
LSKQTDIFDKIENIGIVPVIKLEDTSKAKQLGAALRQGGINAAEVTFRADGADKVINTLTKEYADMLVGAGTVLTQNQVDSAIKAGAKFLVAPGLNPKVVKHCLDQGVPFCPGVSSASEIEQALELGLTHVKFFPAQQAGGVAYINAISAPYSQMRFMPTGGVSETNMNEYFALKQVFACGGSWMVAPQLVKENNFEEITRLSKQAITKMLGFEFVHMGIHAKDQTAAQASANKLSDWFGFDKKDGNSSVFVSSLVEITKAPINNYPGHIAIKTNSIKRAIAYLADKGIQIDKESTKLRPDGSILAVYLKGVDINGFAVHLLAK